MKVNVYYKQEKRQGYKDVYILLPDEIDDAEASEIRMVDALEYLSADSTQDTLDLWVKKLAHKGKITLGIIDSVAAARGLATYKLDVDQYNLFMYGEGESLRKACFTVPQIVAYLESKGLRILKKRSADYRAIIEAERP